jgi:hypothetical protein
MDQPPRRVGARLLLVANLAAATVAAAVCIVTFVKPSLVGLDLGLLPAAVQEQGRLVVVPLGTGVAWCVFLCALALLLANFAWLVRRSPSQPERTYVVSSTPTGPIRVAREALESGLRTAGEGLPEITRLRVAVDCSQNKRVLVRGYFSCAEGTNNLNASQRLRQVLRDRFDAMVHLADAVRAEFELEFQGFLGKPRKAQDHKGALEPEPPPFTGPQYPIEDDEGAGQR